MVDKVIDVSRVSVRMIVSKILVQEIIILVISVYAPQCDLDDSKKYDFYDNLINAARKLGKKKI